MTGALLDADEIFDEVAARTGLTDYAEAGIRARFAQVVAALNRNGVMADWARPAALAQLAWQVRSRLELARDWAIYPEIAAEDVGSPLFVIGHGRTGTTAMQSMLAMGDGCRSPRSWECARPSPPPGLDPAADAARMADEDAHMIDLINTAPGLLLSHPYVDEGALMEVEDEDLFAVDFRDIRPFQSNRIPLIPIGFQDTLSGLDEALEFHRKYLQHLQWKRPTGRWVCKGTQHHYQVDKLWEAYPDSICVWTHRDPAAFIGSVMGIVEHIYTPIAGKIIRGEIVQQLVDSVQAGVDAYLAADWLDDERLIHVRFEDFMRDPIGTIRRIYARAGLEFTAAYEARLQRWRVDPARRSGRHGKFLYPLEKFGLDEGEIRRRFAGYYERFLN